VNEQPQLETKFLRLRKPAVLGDQLDGWQVSWLGGWDRNQLFYWVMIVRVKPALDPAIAFFYSESWESE